MSTPAPPLFCVTFTTIQWGCWAGCVPCRLQGTPEARILYIYIVECQTKYLTNFECQIQGSNIRLTGSDVRLTLTLSLTSEPVVLHLIFLVSFGVIFFWCKTNFLRTAGNLVGAQTGESGFECKSILRIQSYKNRSSLTFKPYLKMRKKADFQYLTLKPFSKSSLTFEVGQRFSLTFEPDSYIYNNI